MSKCVKVWVAKNPYEEGSYDIQVREPYESGYYFERAYHSTYVEYKEYVMFEVGEL